MSGEMILHITSREAWENAQKSGVYAADTLATQGFIHCSKLEQVLRVADAFYKGKGGLVLLVIDPKRLKAELRWEPGDDLKSQLFPHIYGPINIDAVSNVLDFEAGPDGSFSLPEEI